MSESKTAVPLGLLWKKGGGEVFSFFLSFLFLFCFVCFVVVVGLFFVVVFWCDSVARNLGVREAEYLILRERRHRRLFSGTDFGRIDVGSILIGNRLWKNRCRQYTRREQTLVG